MRTIKRFLATRLGLHVGWASLLAGTLFVLALAPGRHVGAASPASLVKDINPGPADALGPGFNVPWAAARGQLLFTPDDGIHGQELWISDGTAAGTTLLADIRATGSSSIMSLTSVNDTVFFSADDGVHGYELWKSDGTPAGTAMVADIFPGPDASFPEYFANANGTLFLGARDQAGFGLWKSDGTPEGTLLVKRLPLSLDSLISANGLLYFRSAEGDGFGNALWRSDGTADGTILLKSFDRVPQLYSIFGLTAVGQQLFFVAYSNERGYELWKSDGTPTGTTRVSDSGPQTTSFYGLWFLQDVNGTLFALVDQSQQSTALWKSDGTATGTVKVKQFDPFTSAADITSINTMANVNGKLVFALYPASGPGSRGGAIWTSDGTPAGTVVIKEQLRHMLAMTTACGKLYFSAIPAYSSDNTGWELWQSDGTAAGTVRVQDIAPGEAGSNPGSLTVAGRQLFFSADDGTNGRELWALPLILPAPAGPTPAIPLPHQIFLPHAQGDPRC